MPLRVLGIDPGLTRCGWGVVDDGARLVDVGVARTDASAEHGSRLVAIMSVLTAALDEHRPGVVALERVFAQQNRNTVMGVAQISGLVIHEAALRSLPLELVTPTEVKAAVTGYGGADKRQVGEMVKRLLGLDAVPKPADAADAVAIAIAASRRRTRRAPAGASAAPLTPAQRAWRDAERASR